MQLGETFWAADSPVSFERLMLRTEKLFLARGMMAKQGLGWGETVAEEGGGGEKNMRLEKKKCFIHKLAGPANPLLPALPSTPFKFPTHLSVSITSFVALVAPVFSVLLMAPLQLPTKDKSGKGEGHKRRTWSSCPPICPSSTVVRRQPPLTPIRSSLLVAV